MKKLHLIGVASDIAGNEPGSSKGPLVLKASPFLQEGSNKKLRFNWGDILYPDLNLPTKVKIVQDLSQRLALAVMACIQNKQFFAVIEGDHSCAIGTWSGAQMAIQEEGPLGLIWIDAHLDSHTSETSPSGNIHGMPVAALLGYGDPDLTHVLNASPKIKPEHLCFIGIRSFEEGEEKLIKRLGVRVFTMEEVQKRGIDIVMKEALDIVRHQTAAYGVSLDLDSIDPQDAPAVSTPVVGGIQGAELCSALRMIKNDPKLLGVEIAEFNPHHDEQHRTEKLITELIAAMF